MSQQSINPDVLRKLILSEPLAIAGTKFGDTGTARVKAILYFLKRCAVVAKVGATSDLMIFAPLGDASSLNRARIKDASAFNFSTPRTSELGKLIIEIREDGTAYEWKKLPPAAKVVLKKSIIYRLHSCVETFSIAGKVSPVPKVVENTVSQLFLEVFPSLKEALTAYRDRMARVSKCYILRKVWDDKKRLWFTAKPEHHMRQALCNYLRTYLRHDELELLPEQNVDETHPVDIKIEWRDINRAALIEIKWLGQSRNPKSKKSTTKYTEARARSGAKQLAEYLEGYRQEASSANTLGYLVVFDGRRKGLKPKTTALPRAKGMHYADLEISYDPKYHEERTDFAEPIRMFLEPVCI